MEIKTKFNIGDVKYAVRWGDSRMQFEVPCDVCKAKGMLRSPARDQNFLCPACNEGKFIEQQFMYDVTARRKITAIRVTARNGGIHEEYVLGSAGSHFAVNLFDSHEEASKEACNKNNKLIQGVMAQHPEAKRINDIISL